MAAKIHIFGQFENAVDKAVEKLVENFGRMWKKMEKIPNFALCIISD